MAYNYRRAEKEWLAWKEKEEVQFRELGVDEDTIQRLHTYDWEQFKKERNFYYWNTNAGEANLWSMQEMQEPLSGVDSLLNEIEDERLLQLLQGTDSKRWKWL